MKKRPANIFPQTHLVGRGVGWQHAQHDYVARPLVLVQFGPVVLVPLIKLLKGQVQDPTAACTFLRPRWEALHKNGPKWFTTPPHHTEIWYSRTQHVSRWNIANSSVCRDACIVSLAYHSVHVLLPEPCSCIVFRFLLRGPNVTAPVAVSMPRVSGCTVVMETSGALALALALAPGLFLWAGPERLLPAAWSVLVPLEPGEGWVSLGNRCMRGARACRRLASHLSSLSETRMVLETTRREVTDHAGLVLAAILSVALVSDVVAASSLLFLLAIASVVHVSKVVIIGGVAIATHSVTTPTPSGKKYEWFI